MIKRCSENCQMLHCLCELVQTSRYGAKPDPSFKRIDEMTLADYRLRTARFFGLPDPEPRPVIQPKDAP